MVVQGCTACSCSRHLTRANERASQSSADQAPAYTEQNTTDKTAQPIIIAIYYSSPAFVLSSLVSIRSSRIFSISGNSIEIIIDSSLFYGEHRRIDRSELFSKYVLCDSVCYFVLLQLWNIHLVLLSRNTCSRTHYQRTRCYNPEPD